eukprot:Skav234690  [mRNA]  locus=scaffold3643:122257:124248:- [translate_table: standard]
MVRSKQYPWGFPWIADCFKQEVWLGNILIKFTIAVIQLLKSSNQWWVRLLAEHPEDLGTIYREEDGARFEPASIWQLDEMRDLVEEDNVLELFTLAFNQCCFGAPYRKPTRLLTNLETLRSWGTIGWPEFDEDGRYTGPLARSCACQPTMSLAKSKKDTTFRTTGTSAYPPRMDEGLAAAILADTPALLAKVGGKRKASGISKDQTAEEEEVDAEDGEPLDGEPLDEHESKQVEVEDKADRAQRKEEWSMGQRPGWGPTMEVSYKGARRGVHDGGGLCSPGRWPPSRRKEVKGEGALLAAEVRQCFLGWLNEEGEKAKEIFWRMAAGKVLSSPFEARMGKFKERIDSLLEGKGLHPRRRAGDRQCEIHFRRMKAMLEMMDDEDHEYLDEVVETGVRLGVDHPLPRTPMVFEEKTKWKVDATDEEQQEVLADNYMSAEENAADIKRQVDEEVALGTIKKVKLSDAQAEYGERLAVASLGAVPKEIGSSKVRVVHDGSFSVDVNRRIRVQDRLRFPLIDDATAVMAEAKEEMDRGRGGVRFSMLYDISRAHKLVPVHRADWGLQAFRLPGGDPGEVYLHTRGTFGIASAAYWWGRCAAGAIRLIHRLSGRALALYHLLYADDGWLLATGTSFWKRILFWMFCLDLMEIPVSWQKVNGGTETEWIG